MDKLGQDTTIRMFPWEYKCKEQVADVTNSKELEKDI